MVRRARERSDWAKRYWTNLQEEVDSAALYRSMAAAEGDGGRARIYRRLAEIEERHADFWEERLRQAGEPVPGRRPRRRVRMLSWLARRFGAQLVVPAAARREEIRQRLYDLQPETSGTAMREEERSHARLLGAIAHTSPRGLIGTVLARTERGERRLRGNALRAAVLGANDGLVSNLSLVMGVAGAGLSEHTIVITGIAGLLAGAFSMAMGEWISVQSARELYERELEVEAAEIDRFPEEEREELTLLYQAKGLPEEQASALAAHLMSDKQTALEAMAREEHGIDPDELGGSPWDAAIASFLLFVGGAVVPIVPFIFLSGWGAIIASATASAAALFAVGVGITTLTARGPFRGGTRQLLFGLAAAAVTYGVGALVGVGLEA